MSDDTIPCPNCDGNGGFLVDSMTLYGIPGGEDWARCEDCKGTGHAGAGAAGEQQVQPIRNGMNEVS